MKNFKVSSLLPFVHMQLNNPAVFFDIAALQTGAQTIDYINIKETDVTTAIDKLSSCFATCSDGFPAVLRKSFR